MSLCFYGHPLYWETSLMKDTKWVAWIHWYTSKYLDGGMRPWRFSKTTVVGTSGLRTSTVVEFEQIDHIRTWITSCCLKLKASQRMDGYLHNIRINDKWNLTKSNKYLYKSSQETFFLAWKQKLEGDFLSSMFSLEVNLHLNKDRIGVHASLVWNTCEVERPDVLMRTLI